MILDINPHFPTNSRSPVLYTICLTFCTGSLALLPFLKIDISIHTQAIVRPSSEINPIRCISTGRVKEAYVFENKKVKKGEVLYVIESEALAEQEKYSVQKISLKETFIRDAKALIGTIKEDAAPASVNLKNELYKQAYITYLQKLSEAQTHHTKAKKDYDRQHKLYNERVIASAEFENYQFELQKADDAIKQVKESQRSQWQSELINLLEEKHELESQLVRIQKEKAILSIKSPISGTLQNLAGVYPGSLVSSNQELGQISPDTSLLIVAYVRPGDIGLLHKNMNVRLQVDAFNYNQWGMAIGKVIDVPQDIKIIDNKPVFEVRCSLDKDFLQLKNGYKGYLKKGMTLQARFMVTERTLWQLLYDKADDWLNPNTYKE